MWLLVLGPAPTERRLSISVLCWSLLSAGPWLIGGFHHGWTRAAWWSLALFLDYLGGFLSFPTPLLGRTAQRQHTLAEEHLTARFRQFLIIALGEM